MICKICGSTSEKIFRRKVLQKYDVDYFQCPECKFIQTEEPYWIKEAYENSINIEDTGLAQRNQLFAKRTTLLLYCLFGYRKKFLDYGGGYGLFVRLMRDYGFDFFWNDPFTENIFARGFEHIDTSVQRYEAVTSFECFEHFLEPMKELETMLSFSDTIIFSTETFDKYAPLPDSWDYYYFSHGQHIALYSIESLRCMAKKYQKNFYTNGKSFHMITSRHIHNFIFNLLLKVSLLGAPLFIKMVLGSKTKSDSLFSQNRRTSL